MTHDPNDSEMNDLRMSDSGRVLYDKVKRFVAEEVDPITEKFYAMGEGRENRWSYAPGQLELLEGVKDKARAQGLWNFFLPDAESGEGLKNLDYAFIAGVLGQNSRASERPHRSRNGSSLCSKEKSVRPSQ